MPDQVTRRDTRPYQHQQQGYASMASTSRRSSNYQPPNRMRYQSNRSGPNNAQYNRRGSLQGGNTYRGNGYGGGQYAQQGPTVGGAFFLGNIDKALTREQVYDFIRHHTPCYISKFDMPNVIGDEVDQQGRPVRCAGFAFVHVRHQWMADEMLSRGTIRIGGLNAEIKPYDQAKRMMSERRHRESMSRQVEQGEENASQHLPDDSEPAQSSSGKRATIADDSENINIGPEVEDWTLEDDDPRSRNWRQSSPVDWSLKLAKYTSMHEESAYQTEDDSISHVSQSQQINRPTEMSYGVSSYANSRAQTPNREQVATCSTSATHMPSHQVRVRPSPLRTTLSTTNNIEDDEGPPCLEASSQECNNAMMVGTVTRDLLDEGTTPTIERINKLVSEKFNVSEPIVQQKPETTADITVQSVDVQGEPQACTETVSVASSIRSAVQLAASQVEQQIKEDKVQRQRQQQEQMKLVSASVTPVAPVSVCQVPRIPTHPLQPIPEQYQNQPVIPTYQPAMQQLPTNAGHFLSTATVATPHHPPTLFLESSMYSQLCMGASQLIHQNPILASSYEHYFNQWLHYYQTNPMAAYADQRQTESQQLERMQQIILSQR